MSDLPPDDPHGDRAWLEAKRRKGRGAILDDADDWSPTEVPDDPDGDDVEGGPPGEPDEPKFDHVRIPRLFGKVLRYVPISLPDDPPITCLGKSQRTYWYLTPLGELVGLADSEHGQAHIEGLWAPRLNDLHRAFPQFDQQQRFKGFQAQYARGAMMAACANKGIFDAHEKVRGLGCWRDDDGQLVQHLGDRVLVGDQEYKPGEIGKYVYPGRPALRGPKAGGREDCERIYARFQMWNFARGEVDARLLLGQIAAGVLGAAIDWRPMAFITGDAGTGKSTLQKMVRELHPRRIISTVDASEASLRALLGQDSLTVSFDEIEADAHSDKAQAVLKLARTSASGDNAHRSSSEQVARSFTLRGSFLFSAIIPPSMRNQDMQRFAFLRLRKLADKAKLPPLSKTELEDLGAGMVGRITGGWPRWERTLQAYFDGLQQRGHEHRGASQFGSCLAAAHILLHDDDPTDEDIARWCDPVKRENLFEYENNEPSWLQAWRIIMTAHPEAWRGEGSPTVAEMIRRYLTASAAGSNGEDEKKKAYEKLKRAGLAIVRQRNGRVFLAIPPKHSGITAIFRGTDFEKKGGEGAWNIPLRGAPEIDGEHGVLRIEKVPQLERQKCPLYWLDGNDVINGERIQIFERSSSEDVIDDPKPSHADRLAAYRTALEGCETQEAMTAARDRAKGLLDDLSTDDPAAHQAVEDEFAAQWYRLEPQTPS